MKELRPKFWIPDRENGSWLFRDGDNDGLPTYELDSINKTIASSKRSLIGSSKSVAIDGGAHVGCWSVYLQQHFDIVHAFEPSPENFECLQRNVDLSKVICHQAALTEVLNPDRKTVPFYYYPDTVKHAGHKGKTVSWRVPLPGETDLPCIEVQRMSIDDMHLDHVDLIKLDVEGHEYIALMGALNTIKLCRPVIVIEEDQQKYNAGAARYLLENLGMQCVKSWKLNRLFVWNT
jgi:FkbM family methyltransferase